MKKKSYPDVQTTADFAAIEKKILSYWQQNNIFQKTIDNRPALQEGENNEFIFYDGPPFANGLPHYGHLLTGFIKDTYARYQTMKGRRVERRFGWDCHGLPAEMQTEKELSISGRNAVINFGIDKFNDRCRTSVMQFTAQWEQYVLRQGRWVDFANSYKTMDMSFIESVLWAFKELYNKGLVYEEMRVMPYSYACETPLSNFETRLDNSYREVIDKAVTCSFILQPPYSSKLPPHFAEYRMLAWTTTPWTLPSNLALAVGENIEYALVPRGNICYILAKFALKHYAKELALSEEEKLEYILGKDLEGLTYQPLFDYFAGHPNSFRVLIGDFVTEESGTGIVHIAPGFGEDDHLLCQKNGIKLVCPVDNAGKFTEEIYDFHEVQVFAANNELIAKLKKQGNWIKTEQYTHNYPHCWRSDTPLIYKAVPSWYVKVTDFKDRMVELNQQINWIPSYVKDNLFGKWLENARDWSISRNRFWGTPLPIWQSDDPRYPRVDVYGSIKELENDFGVKITDLHRPFIDSLTRSNPDDPTGKSTMRRVEDVFDCWFESGSMPYGQVHYPFENKDWFESHFPADFIVEYTAQTRGWFYTLMVLSTALFDRPPFLNCICHGVILDNSGQKLSKRLNNYVDPLQLFDQYGSDALRVTMLSSNVVKGEELLLDQDGKMVFETLRLFVRPIWNAYHFFTMYANADQAQGKLIMETAGNLHLQQLDLYILAKLKDAVKAIEQALDNFDTQVAYNAIAGFFEALNNWYIRRSKNRFWKSDQDSDKQSAYDTLYTCLEVMSRAMSCLLPFISEEIYLGLTASSFTPGTSVHLLDFPQLQGIQADQQQVSMMDKALSICSSALFIRSKENIRVRQPLKSLTIVANEAENFKDYADLIKEEINVKEVIYQNNITDFAHLKLVLNFPILAKRLPQKIKELIAASKDGKWQVNKEHTQLEIAGENLRSEEFTIILEANENIKAAKALPDNLGLIMLDINITQELYEEGLARDLVRIVQNLRKEANLDICDRIKLELASEFDIVKLIDNYHLFIEEQTLSQISSNFKPHFSFEAEFQGKKLVVNMQRLSQE